MNQRKDESTNQIFAYASLARLPQVTGFKSFTTDDHGDALAPL